MKESQGIAPLLRRIEELEAEVERLNKENVRLQTELGVEKQSYAFSTVKQNLEGFR